MEAPRHFTYLVSAVGRLINGKQCFLPARTQQTKEQTTPYRCPLSIARTGSNSSVFQK